MGVIGSAKGLSILASLVRNKLIAVWVGTVGVGLVSLYNSIADVIGQTTRVSMDQSAMRDVARSANDAVDRTATLVMIWSMLAGVAGLLIMCAASPLISWLSFGDTSHWPTFCLLGLVPFFIANSLGRQCIMQGVKQLDRMAKSMTFTAVVGVAVSIPLIYLLRADSIIWVAVSYAFIQCVGSYIFRVRTRRVRLSWREVLDGGRDFIRLGLFMTVGSAMMALCNYLFVIYLNSRAGTGVLGLYQAGFTLVNSYVGVLLTGVWAEYYPHLTAVVHSPRRVATVVSHRIASTAWLMLPVMLLFMACDELIIRIVYADSFLPIIPFITVGITGVGLRTASFCLSYVILARGDGKIYVVTEIVSNVVGLVLNIVGYACAGFVGLGIAYVAWYTVYLAIMYIVYRRRYGYRLRGRAMLPVALGAAVSLVAAVCRLTWGFVIPLLMFLVVAPIVWRRFRRKM